MKSSCPVTSQGSDLAFVQCRLQGEQGAVKRKKKLHTVKERQGWKWEPKNVEVRTSDAPPMSKQTQTLRCYDKKKTNRSWRVWYQPSGMKRKTSLWMTSIPCYCWEQHYFFSTTWHNTMCLNLFLFTLCPLPARECPVVTSATAALRHSARCYDVDIHL